MCFWVRLPAIVCAAVLSCGEILAIAPPFLTDAQLAKFPVIVVAKWEKAPFVHHYRKEYIAGVDGNEAYTRLNILEVIRGDVKPGEVELKTGYGIGWNKDGKELRTYTSSDMHGDAEDVTAPAIWFLKRERSWDATRKEEYLSIRNYRAVQPIELKDFYVAMTRENADQVVPKMLSMENTLVTRRVLRHLCGGIQPWPLDYGSHGFLYSQPGERGKVYREEAERVWEFVVAHPGKPRPYSVASYAELTGKECVSRMRSLLDDGDPLVRGVAVGVLARHRDRESVDRFAKAASGLKDAWESCLVLEELAGWDDPRLVPTFIQFLQNDSFAYQDGEKFGIPVVMAREVLLARTGHAFAFDVELAGKAWKEASGIADKAERLRVLERLAPEGKKPIIATVVGSPSAKLGEYLSPEIDHLESDERVIQIRLSNFSSREATILKHPALVTETTKEASRAYGSREVAPGRKLEFVTIKPNRYAPLEVRVSTAFLNAPEGERQLSLSYLADGSNLGVKAWSGEVEVVFGETWKP